VRDCVIVTDSRDEAERIGALGEEGGEDEERTRERDGSGGRGAAGEGRRVV